MEARKNHCVYEKSVEYYRFFSVISHMEFSLLNVLSLFYRSVYIVYTVLGDVSVFVVGKDEYDELACKFLILTFDYEIISACQLRITPMHLC